MYTWQLRSYDVVCRDGWTVPHETRVEGPGSRLINQCLAWAAPSPAAGARRAERSGAERSRRRAGTRGCPGPAPPRARILRSAGRGQRSPPEAPRASGPRTSPRGTLAALSLSHRAAGGELGRLPRGLLPGSLPAPAAVTKHLCSLVPRAAGAGAVHPPGRARSAALPRAARRHRLRPSLPRSLPGGGRAWPGTLRVGKAAAARGGRALPAERESGPRHLLPRGARASAPGPLRWAGSGGLSRAFAGTRRRAPRMFRRLARRPVAAVRGAPGRARLVSG